MNSSTRVLITIAAVVVIAFGLKAAESVVVSFLLSAFIAVIAAPPIFWLEQRRVPDALAITGVMIAMVGILFTVGAHCWCSPAPPSPIVCRFTRSGSPSW